MDWTTYDIALQVVIWRHLEDVTAFFFLLNWKQYMT